MVKHEITEKGGRTIEAKLTFDEEGGILNEEIIHVGDGDPIRNHYYCECGEDFDELSEAAEHVISKR